MLHACVRKLDLTETVQTNLGTKRCLISLLEIPFKDAATVRTGAVIKGRLVAKFFSLSFEHIHKVLNVVK